MSALRKRTGNARKPRAGADCDDAIYDGSRLLGSVVGRRGVFTAKTVNGKTLAKFDDARDAMRAVTAAARAPLVAGVTDVANPKAAKAARAIGPLRP